MRKLLLPLHLILFFGYNSFAQTVLPQRVTNSNALTCNNWLSTPSFQSYVSVGDLDITGNQITVEAVFNRTAPYSPTYIWAGDIVSKHQDPSDANYLLRPNNAEITTTTGYKVTPPICEIQLNRTYHVALVYDGVTLKFYRDGYLMSSVPATGNLIQNNHQTRIGLFQAAAFNTQLVGYINEVRIWDVARTQSQIRTYMNGSLPNPTTQVGLRAYYVFDNLLNKQGNPTWNGTLGGSASINATNPSCALLLDSCQIPRQISGIINSYTPVLGLDVCKNNITVEDASAFNVGDTVLIIQMKGAVIDSTNTAAFGTITDYKNSGNYEFNYVKSKTGNTVELLNRMTRQYDVPIGKVQLVRVPYYSKATITSTLTCLPWDGSKGGVLVLNVSDSITLNANIDVSGKGFRGGSDPFTNPPQFFCNESNYFYPVNADLASEKGEGIATVSAAKSFGRGALANGGGGGNSHNSGGGGGSNIAGGGFGGYNFEGSPCTSVPFDNRGIGGKPLPYSTATNKIFMGGGGGAGHTNNPEGFQGIGGNGAGIAIIMGNKLKSNGNKIMANGASAISCVGTGTGCHDAQGGGGAGGAILLNIANYIDPVVNEVTGGNGGNMNAAGFGRLGPGGGGGSGVLWLTNASTPAGVTATVTPGQNGTCTAFSNDPWGATPGGIGASILNLVIPFDNVLFRPNIDSVRMRDSVLGCNNVGFAGFAYTNTNPVSTWQWYFGDGGQANTQNSSHAYLSPGTYLVKLVVTDINGCKDSVQRNITVNCIMPTIGNIINAYTPVLGFDPCKNYLVVEDASSFNTGDTVLMIQMKGAVIDSTNSSTFGTVTDYKNAGNYEFNYVKSKTGNTIELLNVLVRQYDIPVGKVQLVRVPYYSDVNITSTLTCPPWDGSKGGVIVLNVLDSVNLSANIDASGKGFRGGNSPNTGNLILNCHNNDYYYAAGNLVSAAKGESIYSVGNLRSWGKGASSNGGGSGNGHNAGGGGGANGSTGGLGGYQLLTCGSAPFDNRGVGGHALTYNNAANKIFLGGGGGSGHTDNAGGAAMAGGNGGGIVIIRSNVINPTTFKVISNGDNAQQCNFSSFSDCHDGSGGGGGAGTILIQNNNYQRNTPIDALGGKGGDLIIYNPAAGADKIGPGGGGSGGVVWFNTASNPTNTTQTLNGGANGVIIPNANDPWGATAGAAGISRYDLVMPFATVPFKANIDSVRFTETQVTCNSYDFQGFGYTNAQPVASWYWTFGDGGSATTQNTSHTYATAGTYNVKLVITDINGCKDSIQKPLIVTTLNFDFVYQVQACSPFTVQFTGGGNDTNNPYWAFGDGNTSTAGINVTHTYSNGGPFEVAYSVTEPGCTDTLRKIIDLSLQQADIIATRDTTICFGSTKQLIASPSGNFCWSPTTYLSDPNISNPITSTPHNITYYYTAEIRGNNILVNGDFNAGNTGFTSQYTYTPPPNLTAAQYWVGTNPQIWNPGMAPCTDHTTGTGNMMMVNGADVPNVSVWSQTVPVSANTNYVFSTWLQHITSLSPAQLQFSINGVNIGPVFVASNTSCLWQQFQSTWNSGTATSAQIAIVNKNTASNGNDFALDDISFAPVWIRRDSVKITVDTAAIDTNPDTPICEGSSIQLNTTGAVTYSWTPTAGLSNPNIANPVATPLTSTEYFVTGINANGCTAQDSVTITVNPRPTITKSVDTIICAPTGTAQLFAGGGNTYSWSPAGSLSNPNIANPVASPASSTMYYVTVTGANGCSKLDSVKVDVRDPSTFSISPADAVCRNTATQLMASGGDLYSWTPASTLNNASIPNPVATPITTTTYSVQISDTICNNVQVLSTEITVRPAPNVVASRSNDIDCSVLQSQLAASGASSYSWSPASTLNNPGISSPVATPSTTTEYTVTGTDGFGCTNTAKVTVKVTPGNSGGYLMPTAFTPNNDGLNDCYGVKGWGVITQLEFSIYNRWGERIFYTTDPGKCWDGRYKGVEQDPDVFVYMVRAKTTCTSELIFRKGTFALIR